MPTPSLPTSTARTGRPWHTVHVTTIDWTAWCFLRSWFAYLQEHGHRVTLVTTAGDFADRIRELGVTVVDVPIPRNLDARGDLRALLALSRAFRRLQPDIVHTHTSKAGFLGRLAARLAGVPRVVHTMHEPPHNAASSFAARLLYIYLERLATRWADQIVTVSEANQREIYHQSLVPPSKLNLIREGLDLRDYPSVPDPRAALRSLGIADDVPVVGAVGRLEPAKGHTFLLQAMARLRHQVPEVRCVIVGSGYLLEALERERAELGLDDCVIFTGFREDMLALMQGFDVFALPSRWEGLGIVLLEAMAYARPLVAAAVGGVNDVVVPGESGLLVRPGDPGALADALLGLLRDPERARALGVGGNRRLREHFRDEVANEKMHALYSRLLGA